MLFIRMKLWFRAAPVALDGFLVARIAALLVAWGGGAVMAQSSGQGSTQSQIAVEVSTIRFGVIEPPVVAQRDITVDFPVAPRQEQALPLEASGLAWLDGRLLITSDRHEHALFTCVVDLESMTIDPPKPQIVINNVQDLMLDIESVSALANLDDTWTVYVMCSLSNDPAGEPLPKRQRMARFHVTDPEMLTAEKPVVLSASAIREVLETSHFEVAGVEPYRTYFAEESGADKNTVRWGSVEGTTLVYNGQSMLCGMRNPLYENKAIVFVLSNLKRAFTEESVTTPSIVDLLTLDLGGRGITGMDWDYVTNGYLISAARSNGPWLNKDQPFPPTALDSALYWWSGHKQDDPLLFAEAPDMTIEGICRLGLSGYIAVVSDEADRSESRMDAQSVVTILFFTGLDTPPLP